MNQQAPHRTIAARIGQLDSWLESGAPYVEHDQHHLEPGGPEQAYWHLGYRAALRDALRLLTDASTGTAGTSTRSPPDGSGD